MADKERFKWTNKLDEEELFDFKRKSPGPGPSRVRPKSSMSRSSPRRDRPPAFQGEEGRPPSSLARASPKRERPMSASVSLVTPKNAQDVMEKEYEAKVARVSCDTWEYPAGNIEPGLMFMHHLAPPPNRVYKDKDPRTGRIKLLIPPTVYSSGYTQSLYYTDRYGYVQRKDEFKAADFESACKLLGIQYGEETISTVMKTPKAGLSSVPGKKRSFSSAVPLTAEETKKEMFEGSQGGKEASLQAFIHTTGTKASVLRVMWHAGRRPSQAFVICNTKKKMSRAALWAEIHQPSKKGPDDGPVQPMNPRALAEKLQWVTAVEEPLSTNIFQASGTFWKEAEQMVVRIVNYVQLHVPRLKFTDMAADFLRSEDGEFYFLQVKGFQYHKLEKPRTMSPMAFGRGGTSLALTESAGTSTWEEPMSVKLKGNGTRKVCRGDYCNTLRQDEEMSAFEEITSIVAASKKAKGWESMPYDEKKRIAAAWLEDPEKAGGTSRTRSRVGVYRASGQMHEIALRSILADRTEQGQKQEIRWFHLDNKKWVLYGKADIERLEIALEAGSKVVQLESRLYYVSLRGMYQYHPSDPSHMVPVRREPSLESEPLPSPKRKGRVVPHNNFTPFVYNMVPVCHDCFRIYTQKDRARMLKRLDAPGVDAQEAITDGKS